MLFKIQSIVVVAVVLLLYTVATQAALCDDDQCSDCSTALSVCSSGDPGDACTDACYGFSPDLGGIGEFLDCIGACIDAQRAYLDACQAAYDTCTNDVCQFIGSCTVLPSPACVGYQSLALVCSSQSGITLLFNGITNFCAVATSSSIDALAAQLSSRGYPVAADFANAVKSLIPALCTAPSSVTRVQGAGIVALGFVCRQGADAISQGIYDNCNRRKRRRASVGFRDNTRTNIYHSHRRADAVSDLIAALNTIASSSGLSDLIQGDFSLLNTTVDGDTIAQVQYLQQAVTTNVDGLNALIDLSNLVASVPIVNESAPTTSLESASATSSGSVLSSSVISVNTGFSMSGSMPGSSTSSTTRTSGLSGSSASATSSTSGDVLGPTSVLISTSQFLGPSSELMSLSETSTSDTSSFGSLRSTTAFGSTSGAAYGSAATTVSTSLVAATTPYQSLDSYLQSSQRPETVNIPTVSSSSVSVSATLSVPPYPSTATFATASTQTVTRSAQSSTFLPQSTGPTDSGCTIVKHYGDSPDTPDSPDGQPETPEIPDYPGGYYYLCEDGSIPPRAILPAPFGSSVEPISTAAAAHPSITGMISGVSKGPNGCTWTRLFGDSPDTPDSPDGQPEIPEIPQDPTDPAYYWLCI